MINIIKISFYILKNTVKDILILIGTIEGLNFLFEKNDMLLQVKDTIKLILPMKLILLIGLIILLINIYKPFKTIKISKSNTIKIRNEDIFKQKPKNLKVIPFDNKFTLNINNYGISDKSLQGKFINKLSNDEKSYIRNEISNHLKIISTNTQEYPIGSSVIVNIANSNYILLALSSTKKNGTIQSSPLEYYTSINSLVNFVEKYGRDYDVVLPLIGSGLSRLNLEEIDLLESLISIIKMSSSKSFKGNFKILVSTEVMYLYYFSKI